MAGKITWKIYYSDGSTFSSADGDPKEAPDRDIQLIIQAHPRSGREILAGNDFYLRCKNTKGEERWVGVDWFGMLDWVMSMGLIKAGRTICRDEFESVQKLALDDKDLPKKSGWHPDENWLMGVKK